VTYPRDTNPNDRYPFAGDSTTAPDGREPVPGSRDTVPESYPVNDPRNPQYATPGPTPSMQEIDPARTRNDDIEALKARIAQLEQEGEARDAAQRRAEQLNAEGLPEGGQPIEHFHQLADGTFVRGFGTATHIADGDKTPMPVIASYAIPAGYDQDYSNVKRSE
jgi:hypothetical protein